MPQAFQTQLAELLGQCGVASPQRRAVRMCDSNDGGFGTWADILNSSEHTMAHYLPRGKIGTVRQHVAQQTARREEAGLPGPDRSLVRGAGSVSTMQPSGMLQPWWADFSLDPDESPKARGSPPAPYDPVTHAWLSNGSDMGCVTSWPMWEPQAPHPLSELLAYSTVSPCVPVGSPPASDATPSRAESPGPMSISVSHVSENGAAPSVPSSNHNLSVAPGHHIHFAASGHCSTSVAPSHHSHTLAQFLPASTTPTCKQPYAKVPTGDVHQGQQTIADYVHAYQEWVLKYGLQVVQPANPPRPLTKHLHVAPKGVVSR